MSRAALLNSPPPRLPKCLHCFLSETDVGVGNLVNTKIVNIGLTIKNPRYLVLELKNFETFLLAEMLRLCLTDKFNRNKTKLGLLISSLTFRHRASSTQDRHFTTLQRTLFIYLINKYISLSDICLTVHH